MYLHSFISVPLHILIYLLPVCVSRYSPVHRVTVCSVWSVISSSMTRCTAAPAAFTVGAPPDAERLPNKGSLPKLLSALRTASEPLHCFAEAHCFIFVRNGFCALFIHRFVLQLCLSHGSCNKTDFCFCINALTSKKHVM